MKRYEKRDGGYMDQEDDGHYYEVAEVKPLIVEAVDLIRTLLADPETGECQICLAPSGHPHKPDCKAMALLVRLGAE